MSKSGSLGLPSKPKGYEVIPKKGGRDDNKSQQVVKRPLTSFDDDDDDGDEDNSIELMELDQDELLKRVPGADRMRHDQEEYLEDDEVGEPVDFSGGGGKRSTKALTTFPAPPSFKPSWDKFTRYWQQCWDDPKVRPRMRVYIYRLFPVMKEGFRRVDILHGSPDADETPAKPMTIEEVLHRYGSGDYHFKINDAGANSRQIVQCDLVKRPQMRDYETYFPVLDLEGLDDADPMNKTFLENLRRRGKAGHLSEDEEMQTANIIASMAEKLLEKQQPQQQVNQPGMAELMQMYSKAAEASIDMVANTRKHYRGDDDDRPPVAAAPQMNPVEMLGAFLQVAERMRPDNTALIEALKASSHREEEASRRYNELMATLLKNSLEKEQSKEPEKDSITRLIELSEAKDQLAKILGTKSAGNTGMDWAAMAQALAPVIAPLAQSLQAIALGFMHKAAGTGAQTPQTGPQGAPGATGGPSGYLGQGQPQQGPPGAPNGQPMAGQPAEGWTDPQELIRQGVPVELSSPENVHQYLEALKGPLLRMLNNPQLSGEDFAVWLMDWKGDEHYATICAAGKDTIATLLMAHPTMAQDLAQRPDSLSRFLDEFLKPFADMQDGDNSEEDSYTIGEDNTDDEDDNNDSSSSHKRSNLVSMPGYKGMTMDLAADRSKMTPSATPTADEAPPPAPKARKKATKKKTQ